ncbi:MAG: CDP-glucose 4,6-dehydratase [Bacteroidia bacterium]
MPINLEKIYKNKKVFITGHTGFKGSWLISWLHILGANIKGYALEPENSFDLYNLIKGNNLCESIIADIRNKKRIEKEILDFKPDFIIHLAAQPLVRLAYEKPSETIEVNATGTAYVLDAVRKLEQPCVVILITTDKVYENLELNYAYKEDDRLGGYDLYSASKACSELIINSYRNSFFNVNDYSAHKKDIASARAGNVIGGGDWSKDRIIPDVIKALKNDETIIVRNPSAVRPWQHVLEPLSGYLHLGAKMYKNPGEYTGAWNFGPQLEDNLTVDGLVKQVINLWGTGTYHTPEQLNQPHEANLLMLDITKTVNNLDWSPKMNAAVAIEKTIKWYKQYFNDKSSIVNYTFRSIEEFNEL